MTPLADLFCALRRFYVMGLLLYGLGCLLLNPFAAPVLILAGALYGPILALPAGLVVLTVFYTWKAMRMKVLPT